MNEVVVADIDGPPVSWWIGIDPGKGGAVALLQAPDAPVTIWDTPTLRLTVRGLKPRTVYDTHGMLKILRDVVARAGRHARIVATIEKLQAMPTLRRRGPGGAPMAGDGEDAVQWTGAKTMFDQGHGMGLWEMALTACGIEYTAILPRVWKRAVLPARPEAGWDKEASVLEAERRYPGCPVRGPKGGMLHDRAEAILLADYGRAGGIPPSMAAAAAMEAFR